MSTVKWEMQERKPHNEPNRQCNNSNNNKKANIRAGFLKFNINLLTMTVTYVERFWIWFCCRNTASFSRYATATVRTCYLILTRTIMFQLVAFRTWNSTQNYIQLKWNIKRKPNTCKIRVEIIVYCSFVTMIRFVVCFFFFLRFSFALNLGDMFGRCVVNVEDASKTTSGFQRLQIQINS